ncbi:MAG: hypothetical protein LBJ09_00045 [Clostridiales bacterium]|jgi:hypothetical protein|nr:hypothetical protein [Clostridiales bacterium]
MSALESIYRRIKERNEKERNEKDIMGIKKVRQIFPSPFKFDFGKEREPEIIDVSSYARAVFQETQEAERPFFRETSVLSRKK